MDEEKLFELAVKLAAANISAGQFQNAMNFETIARDDVLIAYDVLVAAWNDIKSKDEEGLH